MALQVDIANYSASLPVGPVDRAQRVPDPQDVAYPVGPVESAELQYLKQLLAHEISRGAGYQKQPPLPAAHVNNEATNAWFQDEQASRNKMQQENDRLAQENLFFREAPLSTAHVNIGATNAWFHDQQACRNSIQREDQRLARENLLLREAAHAWAQGAQDAHGQTFRSCIHEENERLAQENLFLREAHDDMLFRIQSKQLAMQGLPLKIVPTMAKDPNTAHSIRAPSSCGSLSSALLEESTAVDSSSPVSADASSTPSDDDFGFLAATTPTPTPHAALYTPNSTVMMRNLPNNLTRDMLLELLEKEGFLGYFDFVYLPIDFQTNAGLGYAFINFVSSASALAFKQYFTGFTMWPTPLCDKVCAVTWSTSAHGLEVNIERYRNSPVMHPSIADEFKPVVFHGSERVLFPPPTAKIRAPRLWRRRR